MAILVETLSHIYFLNLTLLYILPFTSSPTYEVNVVLNIQKHMMTKFRDVLWFSVALNILNVCLFFNNKFGTKY
jgi:hypothetical protein